MSDQDLKSRHRDRAPQLLADIGGTHTRLALADAGVLRPGSIRRYRNEGHATFEALLALYLRDCGVRECAGVCLAVAGPVRDGVVRMTNLGWELRREALRALTGSAEVHFLNDLQAQGHALDVLDPAHIRTLVPAPETPGTTGTTDTMTRLVVGIGTGFNAAPVHRSAQGLFVPPSECGHIHLPRQDSDEAALADWLAAEHGLATVEEALCGRGLAAIHRYLGHGALTPEALVTAIAAGDSAAKATGALYTRLLGRVLADLALIHLPYGGICLIGGTARAMGPHLAGFGLATHFRAMGRCAPMMEGFPIRLIEDDFAALTGCAVWLGVQAG